MLLPKFLGVIFVLSTCTGALPLAARQDQPDLIAAPNRPSTAPSDSTLVQIGFTQSLNYDFVVSNSQAAEQIFTLLPRAISDALGTSADQVVSDSIRPLDTTATLGYVTSLALLYVPSDTTGELASQIRTPSSSLYNNADATVNSLTALINPAIALEFSGA